jgi:hypothetical protein
MKEGKKRSRGDQNGGSEWREIIMKEAVRGKNAGRKGGHYATSE